MPDAFPLQEQPLSFATDMVRAVQAGTKTQTRRPVYPQTARVDGGQLVREDGRSIECPFGKPGDRLWVRERFAVRPGGDEVVYSADPVKGRSALQWRPSKLLPRASSRILLAVRSVRWERLQAISEADARQEGYPSIEPALKPIDWFRRLWDRLAMAATLRWDANPWVWVVGFEVIEGLARPPTVANVAPLFAPPRSSPNEQPSRGERRATIDEKRKLAEMIRAR